MDIATLRSTHADHWMKAAALRVLALDAVRAANSGHSGMPMGMADVATVLFEKHLKFDAASPDWPDRDRFILSAGHGSMLLYGLLHLTGYADMTMEQIRNFRQWGAITAGHPECGHAGGIETTTGPLGQGIGNAVGFALAERSLRAQWGAKVVDHRTYVIAGDGCLMEGVSQEAIALAGRQELARLIVLWDNNGITIDGKVEIADRTDQMARFAASGWDVFACDGHDPADIDRAISAAQASGRPALVACKTHIALGSAAQDTAKGARRADRRETGRRHPRRLWLERRALRDPGADPRRLARDRGARCGGAQGLGDAACDPARRPAGRVRPPDRRCRPGPPRRSDPRAEKARLGRGTQGRDPQGLRDGAGGGERR